MRVTSISLSVFGLTLLSSLLILGFPGACSEVAKSVPAASGESAEVVLRGFEFSGAATVQNGFLICDDELVGTVVFLPFPQESGKGELGCKLIKPERKRKESRPFTNLPRLATVQDIEGLASDGSAKFFLTGSHNPKDGQRRTDRELVLEGEWNIEKDTGQWRLVWENECWNLIDYLAEPMMAQLGLDLGVTRTTVDPSFNVEGLAYHEGQLYIGLRGPLTKDGKAILCRVSSTELFATDRRKEFVIKALDLDGGGVRSLEWDPKTNSLLILSGGTTDGAKVEPYLWSYHPGTKELKKLAGFPKELTKKGSPEGVTRGPDGKLLVVFDSDTASSGDVLFMDSP